MQTPRTNVLPGPQKKATCVVMPSGWRSGAGDMACAEVAMVKAMAAIANSLVIVVLPVLASRLIVAGPGWPPLIQINRAARSGTPLLVAPPCARRLFACDHF
jgi:hypothetical protein